MDLLNHVPVDIWEGRLIFLENIEKQSCNPNASYLLSNKATLLIYDAYKAFCAGAWVSVLILCHGAIDATIRDTETGDYRSNSKKLFEGDPDLEWLRKKRNNLVHVSEDEDPAVADLDVYHETLEADAKRAICLLFRAVYFSPGT